MEKKHIARELRYAYVILRRMGYRAFHIGCYVVNSGKLNNHGDVAIIS